MAAEIAKALEPLSVSLREMGCLLHKLVERVEALECAALDGDFPEAEYEEFLATIPPTRVDVAVGTEDAPKVTVSVLY